MHRKEETTDEHRDRREADEPGEAKVLMDRERQEERRTQGDVTTNRQDSTACTLHKKRIFQQSRRDAAQQNCAAFLR